LIKLICNNTLILNTITNHLSQKRLFFASDDQKYQTVIEISDFDKTINLDINGKKIDIPLPLNINFLTSQILKNIIETNLQIGNGIYFPYQRVIYNYNKSKKSLLSDIQNIIITNLLMSNDGIEKELLYKAIWKKDKTIFINKLDTHLTNLKKKLSQEVGIKTNFQSHSKILRLIIN
tara:strand:+ start:4269 stop:4799 length:531 start_codon:yes stop_codon:yes gene_type:complete